MRNRERERDRKSHSGVTRIKRIGRMLTQHSKCAKVQTFQFPLDANAAGIIVITEHI